MQIAKFKHVQMCPSKFKLHNVVILCRLPKVHHRISCYFAHHTHGSYRYSVLQTRPAGHTVRHTVGYTVAHRVGNTVRRLVCLNHKPLDYQPLLSWAQMVEHLVEFHEEVSRLFAAWRTEKRKTMLKYLPGEEI